MLADGPITEPKITVIPRVHMEEPTPKEEPLIPVEPTPTPMMHAAKASDIQNPWVCQKEGCGAILGSVTKDRIRPGLSLSRLILFRGAVKFDELLPANFIFGKVDAGEFICSRCGEPRVWKPSPETLRYYSEGGKQHARKKNRNL